MKKKMLQTYMMLLALGLGWASIGLAASHEPMAAAGGGSSDDPSQFAQEAHAAEDAQEEKTDAVKKETTEEKAKRIENEQIREEQQRSIDAQRDAQFNAPRPASEVSASDGRIQLTGRKRSSLETMRDLLNEPMLPLNEEVVNKLFTQLDAQSVLTNRRDRIADVLNLAARHNESAASAEMIRRIKERYGVDGTGKYKYDIKGPKPGPDGKEKYTVTHKVDAKRGRTWTDSLSDWFSSKSDWFSSKFADLNKPKPGEATAKDMLSKMATGATEINPTTLAELQKNLENGPNGFTRLETVKKMLNEVNRSTTLNPDDKEDLENTINAAIKNTHVHNSAGDEPVLFRVVSDRVNGKNILSLRSSIGDEDYQKNKDAIKEQADNLSIPNRDITIDKVKAYEVKDPVIKELKTKIQNLKDSLRTADVYELSSIEAQIQIEQANLQQRKNKFESLERAIRNQLPDESKLITYVDKGEADRRYAETEEGKLRNLGIKNVVKDQKNVVTMLTTINSPNDPRFKTISDALVNSFRDQKGGTLQTKQGAVEFRAEKIIADLPSASPVRKALIDKFNDESVFGNDREMNPDGRVVTSKTKLVADKAAADKAAAEQAAAGGGSGSEAPSEGDAPAAQQLGAGGGDQGQPDVGTAGVQVPSGGSIPQPELWGAQQLGAQGPGKAPGDAGDQQQQPGVKSPDAKKPDSGSGFFRGLFGKGGDKGKAPIDTGAPKSAEPTMSLEDAMQVSANSTDAEKQLALKTLAKEKIAIKKSLDSFDHEQPDGPNRSRLEKELSGVNSKLTTIGQQLDTKPIKQIHANI